MTITSWPARAAKSENVSPAMPPPITATRIEKVSQPRRAGALVGLGATDALFEELAHDAIRKIAWEPAASLNVLVDEQRRPDAREQPDIGVGGELTPRDRATPPVA